MINSSWIHADERTLPSGRSEQPTSWTLQRWLTWLFLGIWLVLAIAPVDRMQWFAENLLVAGLAVVLYIGRHILVFSRLSGVCIFAFLSLHELGAHYGYAGVPYDAWLKTLTGTNLSGLFGFERNHFDRVMHFLFGLLLTLPMREVLLCTSPVRGPWSYILPVVLSMAASMGYEVCEWLIVAIADSPETAYLILQGDSWDSQKDMALATLGAMLAVVALKLKQRQQERTPGHKNMSKARGRDRRTLAPSSAST